MTDPVIVLLAAGRATRMRGADKLMEPVAGQPLLATMARRCAKAGPTRVVLGPDQQARRDALDGIGVEIIEPPEGAGMAASVVAGIAGLDAPAALIVLADMPEITAHDLHLMLALHARAPDAILRAAGKDGTPGHPVLFPRDLFPALARLAGDQGARDILKAETARTHLVPFRDNRALVDLDTPEDWAAWRETQNSAL